MHKENLYEPFSIAFETLDDCPKRAHEHNFFELVYIVSGTGHQCINTSTFAYKAGHLFLITPEDCHSFDIQTTTQFFYLRFHNIYLQSKALQSENIQRLEFILNSANHEPGCILKNETDKSVVRPLVEAIIREYVNRDVYSRELIQQFVNTLIVIVARNIAKYLPVHVHDSTETKAIDIVQYIQQNIYNPDKIKSGVIGKHFGISDAYLGRYFKKHTHETMQDYITNYKLRLIEHRLQHSDMRMSEIADELGFTDESHLNKFFRKQKGISPTEYRKLGVSDVQM
jgi:AraC-like DNA-binding protein